MAYWTGAPYVGLGNGAHSYQHPLRRWNVRDWSDYRSAAAQGRVPVDEWETLSESARRMERLWLGLRVRAGLAVSGLSPSGRRLCEKWVELGLARQTHGRIHLTPGGWLVLDRLTVALDQAEEEGLFDPAPPGAGLREDRPDLPRLRGD